MTEYAYFNVLQSVFAKQLNALVLPFCEVQLEVAIRLQRLFDYGRRQLLRNLNEEISDRFLICGTVVTIQIVTPLRMNCNCSRQLISDFTTRG